MRLFKRDVPPGQDGSEAAHRGLPIPRLDLTAPPGWLVKESVTLSAPDGLASIIVSSEPVEPSVDSRDYAEQTREAQRREYADYVDGRLTSLAASAGCPPTCGDMTGAVPPADGFHRHNCRRWRAVEATWQRRQLQSERQPDIVWIWTRPWPASTVLSTAPPRESVQPRSSAR